MPAAQQAGFVDSGRMAPYGDVTPSSWQTFGVHGASGRVARPYARASLMERRATVRASREQRSTRDRSSDRRDANAGSRTGDGVWFGQRPI
jgi:hypothetical protein